MSEGSYISVVNWDRFQHYRNRRPPWIKYYLDILTDDNFQELSDQSRYHLLAIWLLAARYDNQIPYRPGFIERNIFATTPVNLDELVSAGFITVYGDASVMLASRKQSAMLERERETYLEKEGEGETEEESEKPVDKNVHKCPHVDMCGPTMSTVDKCRHITEAEDKAEDQDQAETEDQASKHINQHNLAQAQASASKNGHALIEWFDSTFWPMYPKKVSKGTARKAIVKLKPNAELRDKIIASLAKHVVWTEWTKDGGKFIPHPATWINAEGWENVTAHKPVDLRERFKDDPDRNKF